MKTKIHTRMIKVMFDEQNKGSQRKLWKMEPP